MNIASFVHLLKKVDFHAVVDHLAITHIIKSKIELVTTRIKRLLELLSSYSFNLYYIKGKDMVLSDFLSRQKTDDSNSHEIIPISFSLRRVLPENYCKLDNMTETDKYLVQIRSQAESSGVKVPEVHGIDKGLILHVKPEKTEISSNTAYRPLPQGLIVQNTYMELHNGGKNVAVMVRNSMAYPQTLRKKTPVVRAVTVTQVPEPPVQTSLTEVSEEDHSHQIPK